MNLQKIKESITSFSVQFNQPEIGLSYIAMFDENVISNYFKLEDEIDLNDRELLESMIVENIKHSYLKGFVKNNYSTLSLLGFLDENKIMKELI
ncbi:MAG: hypothetical protein KH369_16515 [Paraclostridium bifermentans]|uniref:hypothetical protein n=1 Tax=Paraclostridium bifermentans TaxID=1490 RepID=UPI001E086454|nr:hypothetical protein [Paraclostridium bifermentans]MBS6509807.1 hypothetical protein [Paraclostridium bifermentans]